MPDPRPGYDPRHPHNRPPHQMEGSSIDWSHVVCVLVIGVILLGAFAVALEMSGYVFDFDLDEYQLKSISKPQICEQRHLDAGEYFHHDGIAVDIPTAGVYEICTKPFLWRADQ